MCQWGQQPAESASDYSFLRRPKGQSWRKQNRRALASKPRQAINHLKDLGSFSGMTLWFGGSSVLFSRCGMQDLVCHRGLNPCPRQWKWSPNHCTTREFPTLCDSLGCVCVCIRVYVCTRALRHIRLFATPWTVAHQGPLSMGFFQAKTLQWDTISYSRTSVRTQGSNLHLLASGFFTTSARWETQKLVRAALTKYHRLTGLNKGHLLSHRLEPRNVRSRYGRGGFLARPLSLGLQTVTSSLCPHMVFPLYPPFLFIIKTLSQWITTHP